MRMLGSSSTTRMVPRLFIGGCLSACCLAIIARPLRQASDLGKSGPPRSTHTFAAAVIMARRSPLTPSPDGRGRWDQLHCPSPALHCPSPALHCPSPALHCPSPALHCPSPALHCPSPALHCPSPALHCPSPALHCPSPALHCPSPALHCPLHIRFYPFFKKYWSNVLYNKKNSKSLPSPPIK
ncbi:hypothetical protein F8S13_22970 [Chloroflexia bacterium SDU3-3]|nr:hypothetical protein F8S13_22970 [Chloroflexia bacterium SDU3-3]